MTDLKPCPFCGGEPEWGAVTMTGNSYLLCDEDECRMAITDAYPSKSEAIAAWNTRADNWQPIETAPDAGSTSDTVWVWDRHSKCVRIIWPDGSFWRHEHSRGTCLYSHWQPKVTPAPPKETTE